MTGKVFGRVARTTAVAAVLTAAGAAQAAKYTGIWDPAYGAPFTNLGWRGTATIDVPNSCGTPAALTIFDCPGMSVTGATVDFYDTTIVNPNPLDVDWQAPALATLSWPALGGPNPPAFLFGVTFSGGLPTSVDAGYLSPGLVPASSFAGINEYEFHLELLPTGARLTHYKSSLASQMKVPLCAVTAEGTTSTEDDLNCGFSNSGGLAEPMKFKLVAEVPEPQTYALMLASLAAAGLAMRRRRR